MLCLGKQAKALCTPGEQALAVGQAVEMLLLENRRGSRPHCEPSMVALQKGRMGRGRGGITFAEARSLANLFILCTHLLLEGFPRTSVSFKEAGVARAYK